MRDNSDLGTWAPARGRSSDRPRDEGVSQHFAQVRQRRIVGGDPDRFVPVGARPDRDAVLALAAGLRRSQGALQRYVV